MKEVIRIAIEGMHCGNCATNIENKLSAVTGVRQVSVSLASNMGMVEYDSEVTSPEKILSVFDDLSFSGELVREENKLERLRSAKARAKRQRKRDLIEFAISASFTIVVVSICMIAPLHHLIGHSATNVIAFILTIPVQFGAGAKFYRGALSSIKSGMANMDVLVALGTTIAFFFSVYIAFVDPSINSGMPYFETSCMLITFVMLGKLLENRAKASAGDAVEKLIKLTPETVKVLADGLEVEKSLSEIFPGEEIIVERGDNFPVDGEVKSGTTRVDESMLTGEAETVSKTVGDVVSAGTTNLKERVVILATSVGADTQLSHIIQAVEDAQATKPSIQRLADKIASIFVPCIVVISALTFIGWIIWGMATTADIAQVIKGAILPSIAVICVACPCALGLATPTALMVGMGKGAQKGILIKDGEMLERACKISTVIFDKTGTLTTGLVLDSDSSAVVVQGDEVKDDASRAIKELKEMKIACWMVSGDNADRAYDIADKVGIERNHIKCEVLPTQKGDIVDEIRECGENEQIIAFVGDGINDAPAIAKADVGIAMSSGKSIAVDAGSIVLMHNKVVDVVAAIELSRAVMRKVKQNLFWALIYNSVMIPLAMLGILAPALAGFAMAMSSVCVVCNSLLLKKFR